MTVIAYDGKTLAADKRAAYGTMRSVVTKIHRVDGLLVGSSGDLMFANEMIEWVRRGRKLGEFPDNQRSEKDWTPLLVIEKDGTPSLYERTPYPIRYEQRFVAIGSGREFARAAMHCGKTAAEAVVVASDLDHTCGDGVDLLTLHDSDPRSTGPEADRREMERAVREYNRIHRPKPPTIAETEAAMHDRRRWHPETSASSDPIF